MTGWAWLLLPLVLAVGCWQWDPDRGLRERWRQWRSQRMRRRIYDEFETDETVRWLRSMKTGGQK